MIVVFDKQTKKLLGFAGQVFDNGNWREPTLEELYPNLDPSNIGFVYVNDALNYVLTPDEMQLKIDANGEVIGIERKPTLPKIFLTTDAVDTDGDGIPELVADAKSKATITAQVKNSKGELVTEELTLNFKTTGGMLSARRVTTNNGQATVELISSVETVSVVVEVSAEGVTGSSLEFEFMPSEH